MKKWLSILGLLAVIAIAVAACVPRGPVVVYDTPFLNQTDDLTSVTIYTPSEDGLFLVTGYQVALGANGSVGVGLSWTDEAGSHVGQPITAQGGAAAGRVIHAVSGEPIVIQGDYAHGGGTPTAYNLYITILKL